MIQILDETPVQTTHRILWFAASGGLLLDGLSIFMLGIAIPLFVRDLGFSSFDISLASAALLLGAVVGAALGGRLSDAWGRRVMLRINAIVFLIAAVICAATSEKDLVISGQLLIGMAIGMDFPVGGSAIAECMPTQSRSRTMVAAIALQSVGMLLGAALTYTLLKLVHGTSIWRFFFVGDAVAGLIFFLLRSAIPESPRWLMAHGRNREAARSIRWLVRGRDIELDAIAERLGKKVHRVVKPLFTNHPLGFRTLFDTAYRKRMYLATIPWILLDVAAYGVGLFTAVLLLALHLSGRAASDGTGSLALLVARSAVIDSSLLIGFVAGWYTIPRLGAIRMQMIGFSGMLVGLLFLMAAQLFAMTSVRILVIVSGFMLFNLSMNMGPNSTTYLLPAELYPTNIRGTGSGFSASLAKIGATLGVFLIPLLQQDNGVESVFLFLFVTTLLGLFVTWRYRLKGLGRRLEAHHGPDMP
jgi:MFS family permease